MRNWESVSWLFLDSSMVWFCSLMEILGKTKVWTTIMWLSPMDKWLLETSALPRNKCVNQETNPQKLVSRGLQPAKEISKLLIKPQEINSGVTSMTVWCRKILWIDLKPQLNKKKISKSLDLRLAANFIRKTLKFCLTYQVKN